MARIDHITVGALVSKDSNEISNEIFIEMSFPRKVFLLSTLP